ncbi:hypothetical protein RZS28_14650 [Methylocapsa polymorpha]|uniref:Uncharacterized protein n=1 Tax=Methylocapsa polymorpha TaxID=3080828 RepID=A0ABZ0HR46_9HYPH|nr:hypothetical protein RZS28_14650 [Methylocapsa sp. RX1]
MNRIRRAIVVSFGIAIAIAAGLAVLPVAALIDPVTRDAGFALAEVAFFALTRVDLNELSRADTAGLLHFAWTAVMAICVMPLVFAVLLGEIAKVRSFFWYAGATGFIAASTPWLIRGAFHTHRVTSASPEELRFALVFFFTGMVSGAVFWFIAGGSEGERHAATG